MNQPPWMSAAARKRAQNRSSARQEAARAIETGGRTQPGSGSSWRAPQDVRHEGYLEQVKETGSDRFTLVVSELQRLAFDALRDGREPLLLIEFNRHGLRAIITLEET